MRRYVWLLFFVAVAVEAQTPELDHLFSTALNKLENSALQIESLQTDLATSRTQLTLLETISKEQKASLLEQATNLEVLSSSLRNINEELTRTYANLRTTQQRLAVERQIAATLILVLVVLLIMKVSGYILYAKGIKVPRWLDILL